MASMHTACDAVLSTTELLESILFQLPIRQVLHVQRVSKQWQNTIAGSPNLQVALFLKPVSCAVQSGVKNVDTAEDKGCRFTPTTAGDKACRSTTTTPALINPLPRFATSELSRNGSTEVYLNTHDPSFSNLIRKHCKGSWKSMLLVQPAIYHVTLTCNPCYYHYWEGECLPTFTISNSKGVTILNILMAARRHAELCQCGWHQRPGQSSSLGTLQVDAEIAKTAMTLPGDITAADVLDKIADAETKSSN